MQEKQPVVCLTNGRMRYGVVYSILKDNLQFLAVVSAESVMPAAEQSSETMDYFTYALLQCIIACTSLPSVHRHCKSGLRMVCSSWHLSEDNQSCQLQSSAEQSSQSINHFMCALNCALHNWALHLLSTSSNLQTGERQIENEPYSLHPCSDVTAFCPSNLQLLQ